MTNGSIDAVVNAMRAGAVDFVVKPAGAERLQVSIKNALRVGAIMGADVIGEEIVKGLSAAPTTACASWSCSSAGAAAWSR